MVDSVRCLQPRVHANSGARATVLDGAAEAGRGTGCGRVVHGDDDRGLDQSARRAKDEAPG